MLEVKGQEATSTLKLSAAEKKTVRFLIQLAYDREGTTVFTAPHPVDVEFGTPVATAPDRPSDPVVMVPDRPSPPVVVTAPVLGHCVRQRRAPAAVVRSAAVRSAVGMAHLAVGMARLAAGTARLAVATVASVAGTDSVASAAATDSVASGAGSHSAISGVSRRVG